MFVKAVWYHTKGRNCTLLWTMAYQFAMNVMLGWVLVTVGACNRKCLAETNSNHCSKRVMVNNTLLGCCYVR